jgi:hypothetical protein
MLQEVVRIFTTLLFEVNCPTLVEVCRNSRKLVNCLLCKAVYFSLLYSAISAGLACSASHVLRVIAVQFDLHTGSMKL